MNHSRPSLSTTIIEMRKFRIAALAFVLSGALHAQQVKRIDPARSKMTVYAYRAGLFAFASHDHMIGVPVAEGWIDEQRRAVALTVKTATLDVIDQTESEKNRLEIRKTMLGPKLLDAERFPTISFRSSSVTQVDPVTASVVGILTLHGMSKQVSVTVKKVGDRYVGTTKLKQTDYGMIPISVADGAVKVKDEVKVEFTIVTAE